MRASTETLLKKHPVRKSTADKKAFRQWLIGYCEGLGYRVQQQIYRKDESGVNVIVGDVKEAEIILTAHYDTPANFIFPMFMFVSNWFGFLLSQLWPVALVLLLGFVATTAVAALTSNFVAGWFAGLVVMALFIVQITVGAANKNNANDNSSGVAALLAIMEDLPAEQGEGVAFVFFDQEELGLVGSTAFRSRYGGRRPLINFDCVGDGGTLFFVTKKKFRESAYYKPLKEAAKRHNAGGDKEVRLVSATKYIYPSDQLFFKNSVGVAALKKAPLLGYYLNRIHTCFDVKLEAENIEILAALMQDVVASATAS